MVTAEPFKTQGQLILNAIFVVGTVYSNIILPMQEGWLAWIFSWLRSWFYGPTVSLHDCLAAFFSTDELKGDNMYSCERCCKLRNGIKFSKVRLFYLPSFLCFRILLSRFLRGPFEKSLFDAKPIEEEKNREHLQYYKQYVKLT